MRIVDKVPNKKYNFLLKENGKYFIVIQKDKVIKAHHLHLGTTRATFINIPDCYGLAVT